MFYVNTCSDVRFLNCDVLSIFSRRDFVSISRDISIDNEQIAVRKVYAASESKESCIDVCVFSI